MRIDVVCPSCGHASGMDTAAISEAGTSVTCSSCGCAWIVATAEPALAHAGATAARAKAPSYGPPPGRAPAGVVSAPADAQHDPVVCPRCGLHFAPKGASAGAAATRRPRVLLVEDMDFFVEIAKGALGSRFDVVTARTLQEARHVLASGGVELMLLDLVLEGGVDGRQLLREMPFKPCPVLIFTARDESEMYGESWRQLQALGADDLVVKGMHMGEALARKVAALLHMPATEEPPGR